MLSRVAVTLVLVLLVLPATAQQVPKGFAPCKANSISASGTSSNVQLANCGPSVVLMNITSQEAFFNVGQTSATVAAATNYSLPGNSFLTETAAGWYVAGFTSTGSTTIRVIEGRAQ